MERPRSITPVAAAPHKQNPVAALRTRRRLHKLFWGLLFLAFPLAIMPKEVLALIPASVITFPKGGFAEILLPKLVVFVLLWGLGARQAYLLLRRSSNTGGVNVPEVKVLGRTSPLRQPLLWLLLFLAASLTTSLINPAPLGLSLPLIPDRFESVLFRLLESAWYALTLLAAVLSSSRVLKLTWVFHLVMIGACLAGGWALLEAYGVDPLRLIDPSAQIGNNVQATMGHQSYVAAYLGVVLVFWVTWRLLSHRLRLLDGFIIAFLTACLVASGGRAGLLAALLTLSVLGVTWFWRRGRSRYLLMLGGVMLLAGAAPLLTSPHARARLDKLGSAVQGTDPATSHRLIFWQVGVKAILDRPLTGYGIDAFGNAAWFFATPEQAQEMLTEFLPPKTAARAFRLGNLALYRAPGSGTLELQPVKPYRVHNYFLDIGFASGVPVLLLFIAFLSSTAWALFKARTPVSLATLLALLTYLIYGMVWFATPNVDTLVWGLVGLGLGSLGWVPGPVPEFVPESEQASITP